MYVVLGVVVMEVYEKSNRFDRGIRYIYIHHASVVVGVLRWCRRLGCYLSYRGLRYGGLRCYELICRYVKYVRWCPLEQWD